jgi:biopolymer transport protein ExbD
MRYSNTSPKVNAGSMADIAFLLLVFFLVSTTMTTDQGINRTLPKDCPPDVICSEKIAERNILRIIINANDEIMINNERIAFEELITSTKQFIDNNGDGSCNYCEGNKYKTLSDNPLKAVISIQTDRKVNYNSYIEVQEAITNAYLELRLQYGLQKFKKPAIEYSSEELKVLKEAYPFKISEGTKKL